MGVTIKSLEVDIVIATFVLLLFVLSKSSSDIYYTKGSAVDLECPLDENVISWLGPPDLTLYAVGQDVDAKINSVTIHRSKHLNRFILQITKLTTATAGRYRCYGVSESVDFNVMIKDSPMVTVTVESGPKKSIIEGDKVSLHCLFSCDDHQQIVDWELNGNMLLESKDELHFDRINREDTGNYTCIVQCNAVLQRGSADIVVYYAPEITINLTDHSRTLQCNPIGFPDKYIFFEWEHRTEYNDFIRFLSGDQSGRLRLHFIRNETNRHLDRGKYICSVSNGIVKHGKYKQSQEYILDQKGSPYFASSNEEQQHREDGKDWISIYVVSHPKFDRVDAFYNSSLELKNVVYTQKEEKIFDRIYGRNVQVHGYHLHIHLPMPVVPGNQNGYYIYTVSVTNAYGTANFTVYVTPSNIPPRYTFLLAVGVLGVVNIALLSCILKVNSDRMILCCKRLSRGISTSNQSDERGETESTINRTGPPYEEINSAFYIQAQMDTDVNPVITTSFINVNNTIENASGVIQIITADVPDLQDGESSTESVNPNSSSSDSYLVPCRSYTELKPNDLEIHLYEKTKQYNVEEECYGDDTSHSSRNSETGVKSSNQYESLSGERNSNTHAYQACD